MLRGLQPQIIQLTACNSGGQPLYGRYINRMLKMDDNSIISIAQLDHKNRGVVRLNKDMTTQWLTNVTGYPVAIGIFHDNVLVIACTDISLIKGATNIILVILLINKPGK